MDPREDPSLDDDDGDVPRFVRATEVEEVPYWKHLVVSESPALRPLAGDYSHAVRGLAALLLEEQKAVALAVAVASDGE